MSRRLLWKIVITVAASAATYSATAVTHQDETWALMLGAFVGGVTLVVQFLLDVEARQASVDRRLHAFGLRQAELADRIETSVRTQLERSNQANILLSRLDAGPLGRKSVIELLGHAAAVDSTAPALVHRLAESQILDLSDFLKDLSRSREVTADGDEWNWTFTLTSSVQESIDATSYTALDENGLNLRDDDGWNSELGRVYLDLQAGAVRRGVIIRRLFVLESEQLAEHPELREICERQSGLGIEIRMIDAATASGIASKHVPLIIFDHVISYELTPSRFMAGSPGFVKTTMVLNPFQVHERVEMFQRLWSRGTARPGSPM